MDKKPLIGVSILAVVLLVLGSLSNVVGYQTVQIPQQIAVKERINQRELLFQTIVDIVNKKEIQKEMTILMATLKFADKNLLFNIIKIIFGFILAVIMMVSALMAIPISFFIELFLKFGIFLRLEGFLEYAFVFLFIVAFFCWSIISSIEINFINNQR